MVKVTLLLIQLDRLLVYIVTILLRKLGRVLSVGTEKTCGFCGRAGESRVPVTAGFMRAPRIHST